MVIRNGLFDGKNFYRMVRIIKQTCGSIQSSDSGFNSSPLPLGLASSGTEAILVRVCLIPHNAPMPYVSKSSDCIINTAKTCNYI